jgi:hypothetical protein
MNGTSLFKASASERSPTCWIGGGGQVCGHDLRGCGRGPLACPRHLSRSSSRSILTSVLDCCCGRSPSAALTATRRSTAVIDAVAAALGLSFVAAQTARRSPSVSSWTGIQHAARHRLGGDAGHQGDPETGGDEPESRGPVAGCEGDPWLGDAGPCAELGGVAGTGPDDPPLVCEILGFDPFPNGEGV